MGIKNEVVFRVYKTPTQYAVKKMDGRGLAEGVLTIPERRYFESENKATKWAKTKVNNIGEDARVVKLGEKVHD